MGIATIRNLEIENKIKSRYELFKNEIFRKKLLVYGKDAERIWRKGAFIGHRIFYYERAIRTMELARQYVNECYQKGEVPYSGTIFVAESVYRAKGRYKRKWFAPKGGLWFSVLLFPEVDPPFIHLYPLVAGIACCEALRNVGVPATIKWVNDLMYNGRKIGGILTESFTIRSKEPYLVLGIGININNFIPRILKSRAVSLKDTGKEGDLYRIFILTLTNLIWYIGLLHEAESKNNTEEVISAWLKYGDSIGKKAFYGEDVLKGSKEKVQIMGIDGFGGLRIRFLDSQREVTVYSGELEYIED